MTESPHIVHLDESNFIEVVVEGSAKQPVLVDFWADWCAPCKNLMPILEKLAIEYDGGFVLAKLDTEAHPGIAQQFGIRSLPTCRLFKDQQAIDEFSGALPESEVRKFLDQHVTAAAPKPEEEAPAAADDSPVGQAMALAERGDTDGAKAVLKAAQAEDPSNKEVLLLLGQLSVADNELDTARSCLQAMSEEARDEPAARRLAGTISLAEAADQALNAADLNKAIAANEADSDTRFQLALHTALQGDLQGGMDHLLELVKRDAGYNDGAPRAQLLALFDVLGSDPLVGQYRRKLFALLH